MGSHDHVPVLENEKSYKQWKNAVSMWSLVTDVEREKQAMVVALNLTGKAREAALEIDSADLNKDDGLTMLLSRLDDRRLETYKAFQKLDSFRKSLLLPMREYVMSFQILCYNVKSLGISIPEEVLALKLLHGSGLMQPAQEKISKTADEFSIAGIGQALLSSDYKKYDIFRECSNGLKAHPGFTSRRGATKNVPATASGQKPLVKCNDLKPLAAVDLAATAVHCTATKAGKPRPKLKFNSKKTSAETKLPGATARTPGAIGVSELLQRKKSAKYLFYHDSYKHCDANSDENDI